MVSAHREIVLSTTRVAPLLSVLLAACVAPPLVEPPPVVVDDPITLDEFVARHRAEYCRRVLYCHAPRERTAWWEAAPEIDCEEVAYGRLAFAPYDAADDYADEVARGAARGALVFDPERAAVCLDALSRTCTYDSANIVGCDGVVVGTLPVGSDCRSRFECEPGAFCSADSVHCSGVCQPLPPAGGPCVLGCDACPWEACEYYATTVTRLAHEPCETERTATGELRRGQCSGELRCVRQASCEPTLESLCPRLCELVPDEGDACRPSMDRSCAPGLACVDHVCTRMIVETTAGASCDDTLVFCDRLHRLVCEEGRCVEMGGGVGARCAADGWSALDCDPGLRCQTSSHTCIVPGPDGQFCLEHAECESGWCLSQLCGPPPECQPE